LPLVAATGLPLANGESLDPGGIKFIPEDRSACLRGEANVMLAHQFVKRIHDQWKNGTCSISTGTSGVAGALYRATGKRWDLADSFTAIVSLRSEAPESGSHGLQAQSMATGGSDDFAGGADIARSMQALIRDGNIVEASADRDRLWITQLNQKLSTAANQGMRAAWESGLPKLKAQKGVFQIVRTTPASIAAVQRQWKKNAVKVRQLLNEAWTRAARRPSAVLASLTVKTYSGSAEGYETGRRMDNVKRALAVKNSSPFRFRGNFPDGGMASLAAKHRLSEWGPSPEGPARKKSDLLKNEIDLGDPFFDHMENYLHPRNFAEVERPGFGLRQDLGWESREEEQLSEYLSEDLLPAEAHQLAGQTREELLATYESLQKDCRRQSATTRRLLMDALCRGITVPIGFRVTSGLLGLGKVACDDADCRRTAGIPLTKAKAIVDELPTVHFEHAADVEGMVRDPRDNKTYFVLRNSWDSVPKLLLDTDLACNIHTIALVLTPEEKKYFETDAVAPQASGPLPSQRRQHP
jgi:hypothetical protein